MQKFPIFSGAGRHFDNRFLFLNIVALNVMDPFRLERSLQFDVTFHLGCVTGTYVIEPLGDGGAGRGLRTIPRCNGNFGQVLRKRDPLDSFDEPAMAAGQQFTAKKAKNLTIEPLRYRDKSCELRLPGTDRKTFPQGPF